MARRRVGQGDAFWQYRPYRDGDSANQIDWRQSARSRHLFVRETEWEAAASVWLWRDASPSMQYASLRNTDTKAVRGELLTLALASLLADAGERVAVLGTGMRPTAGRVAVRRIAETLHDEARDSAKEGGRPLPSLPPLVPLPAHGTVVLVSDWLDPLDRIEAVIRHYASGGVRGHLVQVLDPAEEDLPFDGHVKFEGLEAEGQHTIRRVEAVRTAYGAQARGAEGRPAAPDALDRLDGASASHRQAAADGPAVALPRHGRPASAERGVMIMNVSARRLPSEALSARAAGGEGGDPRVSAGRERWVFASCPAHRLRTKHHLSSPLLRNGSLPLPRFAAERTLKSLVPRFAAERTLKSLVLKSLILISARRLPSEALSARAAGGEGGDPRASAGRERWVFASRPANRLRTKHHLSSPLLRNGSLPLPRFAAERTLESLVPRFAAERTLESLVPRFAAERKLEPLVRVSSC